MALGELAGVHVLVVEDTDGARVTTAASAEEAKRILEHVRPHVLVSDIAMPDDSIELIREVMTVAQRKGLRIPAIAVTAYRGRREGLLAEGCAELWRNHSTRLRCAARSGGTRSFRRNSACLGPRRDFILRSRLPWRPSRTRLGATAGAPQPRSLARRALPRSGSPIVWPPSGRSDSVWGARQARQKPRQPLLSSSRVTWGPGSIARAPRAGERGWEPTE